MENLDLAKMKLTVLDEKQIAKIHNASLEILSSKGVHIPHKEALDLFSEAGAIVDYKTEVVKIPEKVVMNCLAIAGKKFTTYGRDCSKTAMFGMGKRNYNTIAGEALWINDDCTERRYTTIEDVRTAAQFAQELEFINVVGSMADPQEIPIEYRCVLVTAELLKKTNKPITFWFYDRGTAKFILELFTAIRGSKEDAIKFPCTYAFLEPISPLRFPKHGIDLLFETSVFSMPVSIGPMAQVGLSAPGTLAGTLAQENAEILAGVCVTQLIKPGIPVCYGGIPHAFDMRTTQMIFAGPEQALMAVAMTQMGKHYGLPVYINVGLTDSKVVDAQAGIEAGITLTCGAMAGADIFGHLGICGVDQGTSLMILTMQHEIIGYVERMMRGIEVSDEAIGIDTIKSVGYGGTYIAEEHTVSHFRKELWFPKMLDRDFWNVWVEKGKKQLDERCKEMKTQLLEKSVTPPMDDKMTKELDRIVESAKKHLLTERK